MCSLIQNLCISGAELLRDGTLQHGEICVERGQLRAPNAAAHAPRVDLTGYLLLPGIIDLHGDAFEHHIAPRPSAPFPNHMALASLDREIGAAAAAFP